jgi:membrane protease YdiL (CAAX protease family)
MSVNALKLNSIARWKPNRDLTAVLASYVLVVVTLYIATKVVGWQVWGGMAYFGLYAVLMGAVFGIGIPVYWTVVVRKRPLSDLGLTTRWLWLSLGLQLVFSVFQYMGTLAKSGVPEFQSFLPLLALSLCIGFFEAVFWRGWMFLRLEEAFGILPALLLGSALYAAYHIGYGMPLSEMVFLFFIGLMYAAAFRLTKSLFILWPVFQPMGQLVTLIKDKLSLPMIASLGFLEAMIVMGVILWLGARYYRKHQNS